MCSKAGMPSENMFYELFLLSVSDFCRGNQSHSYWNLDFTYRRINFNVFLPQDYEYGSWLRADPDPSIL